MKIIYLQAALQDMVWFRKYYASVFPAGKRSARRVLLQTEGLIADNPLIGQATSPDSHTREFPLLHTPFNMLYRVTPDHIEILRIFDNRAER